MRFRKRALVTVGLALALCSVAAGQNFANDFRTTGTLLPPPPPTANFYEPPNTKTEWHWWDTFPTTMARMQAGPRFGNLPRREDSALFDVRWPLGHDRSVVPTVELGGCDLMSGDELQQLRARPAVDKASHFRWVVRQHIAYVAHKGCD